VRGDVQRLADTGLAFKPLLAGGHEPFFGAAAAFAAFGKFRQRGRRLVVGVALEKLGLGQDIGCMATGYRRPSAARSGAPALVVEFIGGHLQLDGLLARLFLAGAQGRDVILGAGRALAPGLPLLADGDDAALTGVVLAVQAFVTRAGFGERAAIGRDVGLLQAQALVHRRQVGRIIELDAGILFLNGDVLELGLQLADRLGHNVAAADQIAGGTLGGSERIAGFGQMPPRKRLTVARGGKALLLAPIASAATASCSSASASTSRASAASLSSSARRFFWASRRAAALGASHR
jgi:hypothetical protein